MRVLSTKIAAGLALALLALPASPAGARQSEQLTRLSLAGKAVTGARESVRGRVVIRTPPATFWRTNRDASPSALFSASVRGSCTARVIVGTRAIVSRVGPVTQTLASTRLADAVLGAGSRDGGMAPRGVHERRSRDASAHWRDAAVRPGHDAHAPAALAAGPHVCDVPWIVHDGRHAGEWLSRRARANVAHRTGRRADRQRKHRATLTVSTAAPRKGMDRGVFRTLGREPARWRPHGASAGSSPLHSHTTKT
jgi:hypothetical protein